MIMSVSSSSTAVNPPTPSLSSLASSTPPSSDFIYVNGNMSNTTPPIDPSLSGNNQLAVSLGPNASLDEALRRVSDLMRENADLKAVLQQNNSAMKEQCRVLSTVKSQWAAEREEMKHKFEQTRKVILDLRLNVEAKEAKLSELEGQLTRNSDEFIVTKEESPSLTAQMTSLRHRREEAEKQAELHSAQNKYLQKQTEKLNDRIAQLIEAKSNLEAERVRLVETNERLAQECAELKKLTVKQQETQEFLIREKQELLALNSELHAQVSELTMQRTQSLGPTSDVIFDRAQVTSVAAKAEEERVPVTAVEVGSIPESPPSSFDGVTLATIKSELEEEKRKITLLQSRLSEQNVLVKSLRQQIYDKDQVLDSKKEEFTLTVEKIKRDHDAHISELKAQLRSQPHHSEDVMTLRAQVTSLVKELQETEQRLRDANDDIERYKHSCSELQARVNLQEAQVARQRSREDKLTDDLHAKIARLEATLKQETEDKKSKEVNLQELRVNFDQLCNDYHELLSKHEDNKEKQATGWRQGGAEISAAERAKYQEQVDNLTAQIITAEDALVHKDEEIEQLKLELKKAKEEDIPLLKAQAEVYKGDFRAEREAREKSHAEKLKLSEELDRFKSEIEELHERNYNLEKQLRAQWESMFKEVVHRHQMVEEEDIDPGEDSVGIGGAGAEGGRTVHDPPQKTQPEDSEIDTPQGYCPVCHTVCPDQDSLRIHVEDCLSSQQT